MARLSVVCQMFSNKHIRSWQCSDKCSRIVNRCWNSMDLRWSQSATLWGLALCRWCIDILVIQVINQIHFQEAELSRQMRSPADIPLPWSVSVEIPNGVYQTRSSAAMNSPGLAASRYIRACFACTRKSRTSQGLTIEISQQLTIESWWTKCFMILHDSS